ncbi:MAG: flagellin lysine-N-methylase [Lachnospiraceae bacterium]|nr:flagellin lysine-N-methylase [Lachnospiraceae bacterium]
MKLRKIAFYDKFKCLAGDCNRTCCHGWIIPLSGEDLERYAGQSGILKLKLLARISSRGLYCFNRGSRTCPFLNKDSLCSLQLEKGHDFIPEACRMFPRFFRNYGPFEERSLDLACIGASSLFLKEYKNLHYEDFEGEPLSAPCTTNDDITMLGNLIKARDGFVNMLNNVTTFDGLNRALGAVTAHSRTLQDSLLRGAADFPGFNPNDTGAAGGRLIPADISFYKKVMNTSFYNIRLKYANPELYRLCTLFFEDREGLLASGESLRSALSDLEKENKEAAGKLAAYYAYYLCLYYLKSYEDYSFLKNASIGIIHLNMILLFTLLDTGRGEILTDERLADIIAVYNRRAYFNEDIVNEMYGALDNEESFLRPSL